MARPASTADALSTREAEIVAIGRTGFWTQFIYGTIIMISVSVYAILMRRAT